MKYLSSMIIISFLFIGYARADQCAWIDADQKFVYESAYKIAKDKDYVKFCEACDGEVPSKVLKAEKVEKGVPSITYNGVTTTYPDTRVIKINGENIDMAYVYIRTGNRVFTNLAVLVGCPAYMVSPQLFTAPGKSPTPISWDELKEAKASPASAATP